MRLCGFRGTCGVVTFGTSSVLNIFDLEEDEEDDEDEDRMSAEGDEEEC